MVWPSAGVSASARTRAMMSVPPPAAAVGSASVASRAGSSRTHALRNITSSSSCRSAQPLFGVRPRAVSSCRFPACFLVEPDAAVLDRLADLGDLGADELLELLGR